MICMPKVIHEVEKCIGCGACAAICPGFWKMGNDGKSHIKGGRKRDKVEILEIEDLGCNEDAANACPVSCISIER